MSTINLNHTGHNLACLTTQILKILKYWDLIYDDTFSYESCMLHFKRKKNKYIQQQMASEIKILGKLWNCKCAVM